MEINFNVVRHPETGELLASWEIFGHGGIMTDGQTLVHLQRMIADAVAAYFGNDKPLRHVNLNFKDDETRICFAKDYFATRTKDPDGSKAMLAYKSLGYEPAGETELHWIMGKGDRRLVMPKRRLVPRY